MHVYLTGFMGAGKTTVGPLLAELLGCSFIELDEVIETRAGASIPEIFGELGEAAFRSLESEALRSLEKNEPAVVATGGGAVLRAENRDRMRRRGLIVFLDPPFELLENRLAASPSAARPLLLDRERTRTLYEQRLPSYRDADLQIEIGSNLEPRQVAEAIFEHLRDTACAT